MEEKKPEHNFQRGDFVTNGSATIIVIGRQGRDKTLFAGVIVQQNDPTDKVHKVGEYSESWHGWKFKKIEYCQPRADLIREANNRDLDGVGSDAVEFAEWIRENHILYLIANCGDMWADYRLPIGQHYLTTAQLYAKFKQQKEK